MQNLQFLQSEASAETVETTITTAVSVAGSVIDTPYSILNFGVRDLGARSNVSIASAIVGIS
jgi:hypothetical protein